MAQNSSRDQVDEELESPHVDPGGQGCWVESRNVKQRSLKRPLIGWREWVALPNLQISRIKAKIDTGARTSALQAHRIIVLQRGGTLLAQFEVHPEQGAESTRVYAEAEIVEFRDVKSSSGLITKRPVIVTHMTLLQQTVPIEITLASRETMSFRLLLGREAIRRRFLVDPGRSYYGGKQ